MSLCAICNKNITVNDRVFRIEIDIAERGVSDLEAEAESWTSVVDWDIYYMAHLSCVRKQHIQEIFEWQEAAQMLDLYGVDPVSGGAGAGKGNVDTERKNSSVSQLRKIK